MPPAGHAPRGWDEDSAPRRVAGKRSPNDLTEERWTKNSIEFYKDSADAVFRALVE